MGNKRENIALVLFCTGIVWFFVENWHFGWHLTAKSSLEAFAGDAPVWILIGLGYFVRPTKIEKNTYNIEQAHMILTGDTTIDKKKK